MFLFCLNLKQPLFSDLDLRSGKAPWESMGSNVYSSTPSPPPPPPPPPPPLPNNNGTPLANQHTMTLPLLIHPLYLYPLRVPMWSNIFNTPMMIMYTFHRYRPTHPHKNHYFILTLSGLCFDKSVKSKKQEIEGWTLLQATSFFPWRQREICKNKKTILKSGKIPEKSHACFMLRVWNV